MAETEETGPMAPNDHDELEEFDPVGTLTLILLYFVILAIAWVFIYFVEFLSRDLVVVG